MEEGTTWTNLVADNSDDAPNPDNRVVVSQGCCRAPGTGSCAFTAGNEKEE
jgi:hypothetical protein